MIYHTGKLIKKYLNLFLFKYIILSIYEIILINIYIVACIIIPLINLRYNITKNLYW